MVTAIYSPKKRGYTYLETEKTGSLQFGNKKLDQSYLELEKVNRCYLEVEKTALELFRARNTETLLF